MIEQPSIKKNEDFASYGFIFLPFLVALLCILNLSNAMADGDERMIEGARKEGEVVFYASMNIEEANAIISRFEKKYPFLKVKLIRVGGEGLLTRVMAEARAKKYGDVLQALEFNMHALVKTGYLGQYSSTEDRFYPQAFKYQSYWTTSYCNPYVIGYNSKGVIPPNVPKAYEDLLHPRWKGAMMMDGGKTDWFAGMLQIMGKEKGLKFMRDLANQNISRRFGHTLIGQLIAAGEGKIDINIPAPIVELLKQKGAPIEWSALGPVPGIMIGVGTAAQSPHPHAAKLFKDFVLSREAQLTLKELGRFVVRSDIELSPKYKALKVVAVNPDLADNISEYSTLMRDIFSK